MVLDRSDADAYCVGMKHPYQFKNRAIQPTAIVTSPGFGGAVMLGSLACVHMAERTLAAQLLVSKPVLLHAFNSEHQYGITQMTNFTFDQLFRDRVLQAIHWMTEVKGCAHIFIGIDMTEQFGDPKQVLEFFDGLDMRGCTVQLVYTTYVNIDDIYEVAP